MVLVYIWCANLSVVAVFIDFQLIIYYNEILIRYPGALIMAHKAYDVEFSRRTLWLVSRLCLIITTSLLIQWIYVAAHLNARACEIASARRVVPDVNYIYFGTCNYFSCFDSHKEFDGTLRCANTQAVLMWGHVRCLLIGVAQYTLATPPELWMFTWNTTKCVST